MSIGLSVCIACKCIVQGIHRRGRVASDLLNAFTRAKRMNTTMNCCLTSCVHGLQASCGCNLSATSAPPSLPPPLDNTSAAAARRAALAPGGELPTSKCLYEPRNMLSPTTVLTRRHLIKP
jgi:hypothetical protein